MRKSAASDLDVIYGFCSLIESEMKMLVIVNNPECIWNADAKSCFTDAVQMKVVSLDGI